MTTNPFILKNYVIVESPVMDSCSQISTVSHVNVLSNGNNNSGSQSPMNLLEIEKYLADEVSKFQKKLHLAKSCDDFSVSSFPLPENCSTTFRNFPAARSQFGTGDNVLDNFVYTDSYIASQQTPNDKKQLCQRLLDLKSMLSDLQAILKGVDTPENKANFADEYNTIITKYNENLHIRELLEQKLDNIYSMESSYGNSKRMLDSTVYVSVLWTILATTFVFYIFKKI